MFRWKYWHQYITIVRLNHWSGRISGDCPRSFCKCPVVLYGNNEMWKDKEQSLQPSKMFLFRLFFSDVMSVTTVMWTHHWSSPVLPSRAHTGRCQERHSVRGNTLQYTMLRRKKTQDSLKVYNKILLFFFSFNELQRTCRSQSSFTIHKKWAEQFIMWISLLFPDVMWVCSNFLIIEKKLVSWC